MTKIETAQLLVDSAQAAFTNVQVFANNTRKFSGEKNIRGHYSKALSELNLELAKAKEHLDRVKLIEM